jgi:transposase
LETKLITVSEKSTHCPGDSLWLEPLDGLVRFLNDGRIEMDTNIVECAMRPIATNKSLYPSFSSVCKHWGIVFARNLLDTLRR